MTREEVIKGLECCMNEYTVCRVCGCPYYGRGDNLHDCYEKLSTDALALLKEQEPVELIENAGFYFCGACRYAFTSARQKFCPNCGRAVKWNDSN